MTCGYLQKYLYSAFPQVQMKDSQEKHVVSRKPLQNSMNKQNSASQPLQNCPVCLKDTKKRARKRRSRGKGKDIQVVENLKEIGVHHDLQVESLVSSKGLTFHRRPGYGQAGTKCIVKANHFLAELPDKYLNHYHVMSIGRSFYSPDIRKPQRLGEGLQSWRGFYQSLRPTQMGLSLNIDMSSASFMEPLPIIEFVVQILGKDILMRPLSDADRIKVANDPANPPSRTNIFVVTHTRKNGTFVSEEVRQKMIKINEIVARDPSSKHKDLDHDPVAEVFGKDGRGRVLGLGSGVSKTTLTAAAPYKRKAKEVERSKLEFQSQIDDLKQQVIDRKKTQMEIQSQVNAMLAMQGINQGAPTQISTNSPSDQTTGHSLSSRPMVSRSTQTCELQSMGGRVVAIGRMFGDREDVPENAYHIIVDEILEFNAELFGARGKTFSDIDMESCITWPKAFTNVI